MASLVPSPSQQRYDPSDPRRASERVKFSFNPSTSNGPADVASLICMAFGALAMLTRFYAWAWLAILVSVSSINTKKQLSSEFKPAKQGGMYSGWSVLIFSFTSLFSIYFPVLSGQQQLVRDKAFGLSVGTIPLNFGTSIPTTVTPPTTTL